MGHPSDDGPAPSSTVTYPPVLSVLARDHRSVWQEKAGDQVSRVRHSLAEPATFGPNPTAARFASVYDAARAEYARHPRGHPGRPAHRGRQPRPRGGGDAQP